MNLAEHILQRKPLRTRYARFDGVIKLSPTQSLSHDRLAELLQQEVDFHALLETLNWRRGLIDMGYIMADYYNPRILPTLTLYGSYDGQYGQFSNKIYEAGRPITARLMNTELNGVARVLYRDY